MGFGELVTVLIVGLLVFGPKELPKYLRKAGQFAGRLRMWATELRHKSGIDEILRVEGIDHDIAEIRKLTRGELTGVVAALRSTTNGIAPTPNLGPYAQAQPQAVPTTVPAPLQLATAPPVTVDLEREYPIDGADNYDALPDVAVIDETESGAWEAAAPVEAVELQS